MPGKWVLSDMQLDTSDKHHNFLVDTDDTNNQPGVYGTVMFVFPLTHVMITHIYKTGYSNGMRWTTKRQFCDDYTTDAFYNRFTPAYGLFHNFAFLSIVFEFVETNDRSHSTA